MENLISNLLTVATDPKIDNIIRQSSRPNFWSIIEYGRESYETRYSKMLRWLLDPNENHGLGNLFAQKFLEVLLGEAVSLVPSKNSGCLAEKRSIDVFYYNKASQLNLTIELKVNSTDHTKGATAESQLDDYYDKVTKHPKYGNTEIYSKSYFAYVTINGDEPTTNPKSREHWKLMSYDRLISVLNQVLLEVSDLDVMKIILDFRDDLQTRVDKDNLDLDAFEVEFSEKDKKILRELGASLFDEKDNLPEEIDAFYKSLQQKAFDKHLSKIKLNACLQFLYDKVKVGKQNHQSNPSVQTVMRRLFNHYVREHQQISDAPVTVPKEQRVATLKPELADDLGMNYLRITQGKGQGLNFYSGQEESNSDFTAYLSGDNRGRLFNDGFRVRTPGGSQKIKISDFPDASKLVADESEFAKLVATINTQLKTFTKAD